jgi:hypothetical protein
MSVKAIFFSVGCVLAWFVLLPVVVIGGGISLFLYAILAELGALITGDRSKTVDASTAREMARRMCGGYAVQARSTRRLPLG